MQALMGITYISMLTWVRLPVSVYSWMAVITASTMARYKVTKYLHIVQELCESRGGRPGLSVLTSLLVSVDVKLY